MGLQITRQLDILRTLSARRLGITTGELALEYGVSTRTIQRDLSDLSAAGFTLYNQRREGQHIYWFLQKAPDVPQLYFPAEELIALLWVEQAVEMTAPFDQYLHSALRRIMQNLPEATQSFLKRAGQAYTPHPRHHKTTPAKIEVVETLNRAIPAQRVCQVEYQAIGRQQSKSYEIEPLRLFHHDGGLYLIARLPKWDRLITQAVERIKALTMGKRVFKALSQAKIDARIESAFGVKDEKPFKVAIYFPPHEAPFAQERLWHPSQTIEDLDDGALILRFRASGFWEIKRWVLSFGPDARVLEPEPLRQAIADDLRTALGHYEKNTP